MQFTQLNINQFNSTNRTNYNKKLYYYNFLFADYIDSLFFFRLESFVGILCFRCDGKDVKDGSHQPTCTTFDQKPTTEYHSQHFPLFPNNFNSSGSMHSTHTHTQSSIQAHFTTSIQLIQTTRAANIHNAITGNQQKQALANERERKWRAVYAHHNFPLNKYVVMANTYFSHSQDSNQRLLISWARTHTIKQTVRA